MVLYPTRVPVGCPTCGGVTSKPGSPCTRCTKRQSLPAIDPEPEDAGPVPEVDLPAPTPLLRPTEPLDVASFSVPRDVATGVADMASPPPVTLLAADPARLLAGFGATPRGPVEVAAYAFRVHRRLKELRQEREIARQRKPHEVPLYDAALKAYDERAYAGGLAILGSMGVFALLLFLLPLVLRVLR